MSDVPKYRIAIADCTSSDYHSGNLDQKAVGGIPLVTTRLAEHLAAVGHDIHVFNRTSEKGLFNKVHWHHLDQAQELQEHTYDFVICNNDTRLFARFRKAIKGGAVPLLWAHNLITYKRLLKKKRLPSLLRYRPHLIVLSHYHKKATPKFLPFRSVTILPHAVDERFFAFQKTAKTNDTPYAVFVSKSYRGLKPLVELWKKSIHTRLPEAKFKAYVGEDEYALFRETPEELAAVGITLEERLPQDRLMNEMAHAKCLLYEGHPDETFCFAAAESTVLGLPIVTRGIGALSERVNDGINGMICKTDEDMADAVIAVMSDPALYSALSQKAREVGDAYAWDVRLSDWEALFSRLIKR